MFTTPPTKKTKPASLKTKKEMAEAVGVDISQASRWTRRPDWPFHRNPPWPQALVSKIQRWAADTLEKRGPPPGRNETPELKSLREEKLRQEVRALRSKANAAETEESRIRGKLIDAAQVESDFAAAGMRIRNGFANLSSQLVPLALGHGMPHESAGEFGIQIDEAINGILRHLSSDGTEDNEEGGETTVRGPVPARAVDAVGVD